MLEAAGAHGAPVVFTSTGGALYGDEAPRPTPEDRIPAPLSPYGASKWAAEAYVNTWSLSSGIPHAVCRLGNVYGPRQSPHGEAGVVAIFTARLYSGRAPKLYGHGKPDARLRLRRRRGRAPCCAASGTRRHLQRRHGRRKPTCSAIWREPVSEAAGVDIEPELAELRPGELQHSCLDISRAEAELGWSPKVSIDDGLAMTYRALSAEFAA